MRWISNSELKTCDVESFNSSILEYSTTVASVVWPPHPHPHPKTYPYPCPNCRVEGLHMCCKCCNRTRTETAFVQHALRWTESETTRMSVHKLAPSKRRYTMPQQCQMDKSMTHFRSRRRGGSGRHTALSGRSRHRRLFNATGCVMYALSHSEH